MKICPKERCAWATGGVCVIPCMDKDRFDAALKKKNERDEIMNAAYERGKRNKLVSDIAAYSNHECDQVLALRRKYKAKNISQISTEDIEAFLKDLKEGR